MPNHASQAVASNLLQKKGIDKKLADRLVQTPGYIDLVNKLPSYVEPGDVRCLVLSQIKEYLTANSIIEEVERGSLIRSVDALIHEYCSAHDL